MKRWNKIGIVVVALAGLAAVGAAWAWWTFTGPLYVPGMVVSGANLRGPLDPPAQDGDSERWRVESDIELSHWMIGGGPPVLVVHGGPGFPFEEAPQAIAALAGKCTFHFYDQRGCGRSSRPFDRFASTNYYANMIDLDRTLGIGAQLADIERIRRLLKQDQLILIGHSFGAFLAAIYAAEFPDRVRGLVLVAPAGVLVLPAEGDDLFAAVGRHLPQETRAEYGAFVKEYLDFRRLFERSESELAAMNRRFGDYFLAAAGRHVQDAGTPSRDNGGWMVQAMYLSMGQRHDYRPALKRITAPTLVLHGADDLVPQSASHAYADMIPNARLDVIPSAQTDKGGPVGHFLLSDDSGTIADLLGKFLVDCTNNGNRQ
jgi:proline iminopeptidase